MIGRAFISPAELYPGRSVTYAEVATLASTLNRAEALHFLAFLNLLLSAALTETKLKADVGPVRDVQTWLFREVVSEKLLADLKAKFRDASLLDRPILHRSQLLFAIRLVATHGQAEGGNMLAARPDFDVFGDLLFAISGLFDSGAPPAEEGIAALWVATHAGPLYELENPPAIELTWPRIQELLIDRLPKTVADPAELERLEQIAVFTTGFSVQAWLDLSFMLFSYWAVPTFRELMDNRGRAYLDPNEPHAVISRDMLTRAIDGLSIAFADVPNTLAIDAFSTATLFDLTPFRAKPLWRMPDGRVLCIDSGLLTERLGPHAFWSIMNALDTPERRHRFSGAWGSAFEAYALDAFDEIFSGRKWSFYRNPFDNSINEELWDGLALRDTTAIPIEVKGTFIQTAAKYSGVRRRFARGLTDKFGMGRHGGAFQLARGISSVWYDGSAVTEIKGLEKATDVFPVLVVQDPILDFGGVCRVVSDRLQKAIERRKRRAVLRNPKIWPLTVLTADDLDRLTASVEATGVRLDAVLKRFHRTFPSRARSITELLNREHAADFGFPDKVRGIVSERFKTRTAGVLERFRAAEYGGAREPERQPAT
jgi:hypothetical protein